MAVSPVIRWILRTVALSIGLGLLMFVAWILLGML
jgi:hypothetical protein